MRGRVRSDEEGARPTCYACYRPIDYCVCGLITPFSAHCRLLLLQHPNEWRKHHSTVRILRRAISNLDYLRGVTFSPEILQPHLVGRQVYLLYPGQDARPCEEVSLSQDDMLVVVDGTWDEAGKIVHRNPLIKALPRLSFSRQIHSNYRIRKEPKVGCLSTVEAVAHFLQANAEAQGRSAADYAILFKAFDEMVDRHLAHFPRMRDPAGKGMLASEQPG